MSTGETLTCEPSGGGAVSPAAVPVVSGMGVPTCAVAAGKRLAMPAGAMPPASSFLAIPGGRSRPRPASPGGTTFDLPDEESCDGVTGTALEMCICRPRLAHTICRDGLTTPQPL